MKKILTTVFVLLLACSMTSAIEQNNSQSVNSATKNSGAKESATKKRGPIFRATKNQIQQAQALLKERGLYTGESSGKLNPETRAALKKFQASASIKETGTLNRMTLEKMGIALTEGQQSM